MGIGSGGVAERKPEMFICVKLDDHECAFCLPGESAGRYGPGMDTQARSPARSRRRRAGAARARSGSTAAYQALIDGGVEAVKILPLASRLDIARTSFYWFFKDREALLAALPDAGRRRTPARSSPPAQAYADTEAEAMLNVIGCFLDPGGFDARFEFAVRSWALQSPDVTERVNAADRADRR